MTRERSCSSTPASSGGAAQRADEPRRLDGRRVGEPNAAAEERRDAGLDRRRRVRGRPARPRPGSRPPPPRPAQAWSRPRACPPRRSHTSSPSASTGRDRALRRPGEDERSVVAEPRAEPRQRAPVGLEEAAVPAARPVTDVLGLEHDRRAAPARAASARARSRAPCSRRRRSRRRPRPHRRAAPPRNRAAPRPATTACGSARAIASRSMAERAFWNPMTNIGAFRDDGITIVRGEASTVWDDAGNALIDISAALWYCNVGYGRRRARGGGRRADAGARAPTRRTTASPRRRRRRWRRAWRRSSRWTAPRSSSPRAAASRSTRRRSSRARTGPRSASRTSTWSSRVSSPTTARTRTAPRWAEWRR